MAEVSQVAVKYSQSGAKAVQRADENVRDSIQRTSRVAEKETGTISRWMERHQTALASIGVAMTALMAGIVRATPSLNASMASIRMAFSLIAMEIGQNLAPQFRALEEASWDLYESWNSLDEDTQEMISKLVGAAAAIGALATVITGIATAVGAVAGPLKSLGGVFSTVSGFAKSLGAAIAGIFGVGIGAWVATQITYLMTLVKSIGKVRGAATFLLTGLRNLARFSGLSRIASGFQVLVKWAAGATTSTALLRGALSRVVAVPIVGTFAKWAAAGVAAFASLLGVSTAVAGAIVAAILAITAIGIWNDRFNFLHDTIDRFLGRFVTLFEVWAKVITDLISDTMDVINAIFNDDMSVTIQLWQLLKNFTINILRALVVSVLEIIGGLGDLLILLVGGFISGLVDIFWWLVNETKLVLNALADLWPSSWKELKRETLALIDAFVKGVVDLFVWMYEILVGGSIIPDTVNEIIGWFKKLPTAVFGVVDKFVNGVKKRIDGLGKDVVGGFQGMASGAAKAVKNMASDLKGRISNMASDVMSTVDSMETKLVKKVENSFSSLTSSAKGLKNDVTNYFSNLESDTVKAVKKMGNRVKNKLKSSWNDVKAKARNLKDRSMNTFNKMKTDAVSVFNNMSTRIMNIVNKLYNDVTTKLNELETKAKNAFKNMESEAVSSTNSLKNDTTTKFNQMKNGVTSTTNNMANDVTGAFQGAYNKIVGNSIVPQLHNQVTNWFNRMDQDVVRSATQLRRGVINNVSNMASNITSRIANTVRSVTSNFASFSREIGQDAANMARNLDNEFGQMSRDVGRSVDSMASGLSRDFRGMWQDARAWGSDIVSDFADELGYTHDVDSAVSSIQNSVGNISDITYDAWDWGRDIGDELANGLDSAETSISDGVDDIRETIEDALSFDRVANDRMARRWGSDFVQEFSRGLQSEFNAFERMMPVMEPSMFMGSSAMGGGSSTTRNETNVTIERGAIQFNGGGDASRFDESELAEEIADKFGSDYGGRTR